MKMERHEHIIPPGTITFEITDDTGHTIILSPERAHELLSWLYDQRTEMHQFATGDSEPTSSEQALPPTWIIDDNHHEPI